MTNYYETQSQLAEEIRQAKEHLDRALARAINRDSLEIPQKQPPEDWEESAYRWVNPPIYDVVDWPDTKLPRSWDSLEKVPAGQGVVVEDKDGDHWKVKADGSMRLRVKGEKKWLRANEAGYPLKHWDHFGPFTEV